MVSTTVTAGMPSTGWMSTGMPRPLSSTRTPPSSSRVTTIRVAVAGQRLVDGVVHDLPHEVVQAALAGRADVHARPLADGLEALEDLDRGGVVLARLDRVARAHRRQGSGLAATAAAARSMLAGRSPESWRGAVGRRAVLSSGTDRPGHLVGQRAHLEVVPHAAAYGERNRQCHYTSSERRIGCACSGTRGPTARNRRLASQGRLERRCRGSAWSPYGDGVPGRMQAPLSAASAVGVAGTPTVPDRARPRFQRGAVRAPDLDEVTVPSPSSSLSRRSDGGRQQPHLGGPGRRVGATTRRAVGEGLGQAVLGHLVARPSRPTARRPRAPGRRCSQPCSAISRPMVASSVWGSRSSGCAPDASRVDAAGRRPARRLRAGRHAVAPASGRCCAPGRGRCPRAARAVSACCLGPAPRRVLRRRHPRTTSSADDLEPRPGERRRARPPRTAAVTSTCSAPATSSASRSRRPASSSAKTSSRIRIGSSPSARSSSYDASRSASANDQTPRGWRTP